MEQIKVLINDKRYTMTLADTQAAQELLSQLPLKLELDDFNQNEKVGNLGRKYPTASENVDHIYSGDVMLYGDDNFVIFYKNFPTPYSYTRLGRLEGADNLSDVVGRNRITVEITK